MTKFYNYLAATGLGICLGGFGFTMVCFGQMQNLREQPAVRQLYQWEDLSIQISDLMIDQKNSIQKEYLGIVKTVIDGQVNLVRSWPEIKSCHEKEQKYGKDALLGICVASFGLVPLMFDDSLKKTRNNEIKNYV